jgi:septal ring-binding cell division protein DamX
MPDLNLIDEGGFDESEAPAAPAPKRKSSKGGGGGGGSKLLIVLLLLLVIGGGGYFLYKKGIIKIPGKKAPIAQIQEEPFPQEPIMQPPQEQRAQAQKQVDTGEVALLEAPPAMEQPSHEAEAMVEPSKKGKGAKKAVSETEESDDISFASEKLSEMQGSFTVQVVAYSEKREAEIMTKRLQFSGYPSFVEEIPEKGGTLYAVRIGRYPSREDARRAVKTFAAQLQDRNFIVKIRNR